MLSIQDFLDLTYRGLPSVRVTHDADQSTLSGAATTLAFNTEVFDRWGMHDPSSNNSRITCVVPGIYLVGACIRFEANTVETRSLALKKNNTNFFAFHRENAASTGVSLLATSGLINLVAGDYVEVIATQNSSSTLDVEVTADYSPTFWASFHSRA